MLIKYPGLGLGIKLLKTLEHVNPNSILDNKWLYVEAIPRILRANGLNEILVKNVEPHVLVDRLGFKIYVNTSKCEKLKHRVLSSGVKRRLTLKSCIKSEVNLYLKELKKAFRRIYSITYDVIDGEYILHSSPVDGIVFTSDAIGDLEIIDPQGRVEYVVKVEAQTLKRRGKVKNKLVLSSDKCCRSLNLSLELTNNVLAIYNDDLWWEITCKGGFSSLYSNRDTCRVVGDYCNVLFHKDILELRLKDIIHIKCWNATGDLSYIVDLSKYVINPPVTLTNVIYLTYGIDGVGGIMLAPLFNVICNIRNGEIEIKPKDSRGKVRLLLYKGFGSSVDMIKNSLNMIFPVLKVRINKALNTRYKLLKVYPQTVVPLLIGFENDTFKVTLWNASSENVIARVQCPKPIVEALILKPKSKLMLRYFNNVVMVPVARWSTVDVGVKLAL